MPTSSGQGERVFIESINYRVQILGTLALLYSQRIHEEKETKNTKMGLETDSEPNSETGRATELVDL